MFSRWGAFVYRHRRPVAIIALVIALAALVPASKAAGELSSGGWLDPTSESATVADRLATDFGAGRTSLVVLVRSTAAGADATSPAFQAAIAQAVESTRQDPNVTGIVGYAETGDRRFISTKGDAAYVLVQLGVTDEGSVPIYPELRATLAPPAGYSVQVSGYAPLTIDSAEQAERDLQKGELV